MIALIILISEDTRMFVIYHCEKFDNPYDSENTRMFVIYHYDNFDNSYDSEDTRIFVVYHYDSLIILRMVRTQGCL